MERLILSALAVVALASTAVAPASALNQRFQRSYEDNLNSRVEQQLTHQSTLVALSQRYRDRYFDNLNSAVPHTPTAQATEIALSKRQQDAVFNSHNNS